MKCNVGKTDRIIRIVASLAFIALGAGWWKGFYVTGAAVFLTAVIAWCPLTAALGISTCREEEREEYTRRHGEYRQGQADSRAPVQMRTPPCRNIQYEPCLLFLNNTSENDLSAG